MELDVFRAKARLEVKKGRPYSVTEMSEKTGLHRNGLRRILRGDAKQVSMTTLAALLEFFRGEGLSIQVGDLFREVPASS